MKTVYDFTVKDRKENDVSLSEYKGKVLLIVNTATGCGFTPHYDPLFAFLASEKPFEGFGKGVKNALLNKFAKMNNKKFGDKTYIGWNFTKFLIDRDGNVVARFEPTVDMKDVRAAVERILE